MVAGSQHCGEFDAGDQTPLGKSRCKKNVSSGQSVFNSDNGYAAVFHMDPSLTEETGKLTTKDRGTVDVAGVIGPARRFTQGYGVFCGDKITTLPAGSGPNTTHAWFRSDLYNVRVLGWGNEEAQGKVILNYRSPPHVRMECYFSGADVAGKTPVKKIGLDPCGSYP